MTNLPKPYWLRGFWIALRDRAGRLSLALVFLRSGAEPYQQPLLWSLSSPFALILTQARPCGRITGVSLQHWASPQRFEVALFNSKCAPGTNMDLFESNFSSAVRDAALGCGWKRARACDRLAAAAGGDTRAALRAVWTFYYPASSAFSARL